jgi:hypothetical protein
MYAISYGKLIGLYHNSESKLGTLCTIATPTAKMAPSCPAFQATYCFIEDIDETKNLRLIDATMLMILRLGIILET